MKQIKQLEEVRIGRGEVKGHKFVQIRKSKKGYCYEVSINGIVTHYEVFRLRINKRFDPHYVSYPRAEGFGVWAWTTKRKEKALDIFDNL